MILTVAHITIRFRAAIPEKHVAHVTCNGQQRARVSSEDWLLSVELLKLRSQ